MQQYKYELHSLRKSDDLIVDRYEQYYDADGNRVAESKPHTTCVHPGMTDPDWPAHISAMVKARHTQKVIKKYKAEQTKADALLQDVS